MFQKKPWNVDWFAGPRRRVPGRKTWQFRICKCDHYDPKWQLLAGSYRMIIKPMHNQGSEGLFSDNPLYIFLFGTMTSSRLPIQHTES